MVHHRPDHALRCPTCAAAEEVPQSTPELPGWCCGSLVPLCSQMCECIQNTYITRDVCARSLAVNRAGLMSNWASTHFQNAFSGMETRI